MKKRPLHTVINMPMWFHGGNSINDYSEADITTPLVEILVKRSSDKVATIRAKALGYVAAVIEYVSGEDTKLFDIVMDSCSRNAGKADSVKEDDEWIAKGKDSGDRTMEFLRRRVQGTTLWF